jgi:UDP-4-amino-4,6-dideoxy-N-acetyl-beta-L-altrosamine N-acetyltransferase
MIDLRIDYECDGKFLKNFINLNDNEKELVRRWRNYDNIRKWMFSDKIIAQEEHLAFINRLQNDTKNAYWLVKDDERYMGVVYLNKIDRMNKNAFLGIYTNPENNIKGTGSSLIKCIKKLSFEIAGFHALKLEVLVNNEKAIYLYKKMGFIEKDKIKDFVVKNGEWQDVLIMGITD